MPGFCEMLFPNSVERTQRQIEKIDEIIDKINADIQEKRKKLKEIKDNINLLNDPSNKLDSKNSSRSRMIETYKKRMGIIMKHIKDLESQLAFFEKSKYSLENNQMSKELSEHIAKLKAEMLSVKTIDADQLVNDTEEITEVNDFIDDFNSRVRVSINAWNTDVDVDEDEIEAYLEEDDSKEESHVVNFEPKRTKDDEEFRKSNQEMYVRDESGDDAERVIEKKEKRLQFALAENLY